MSHTINITDLTDQDAVHRVLSDIRSHGASYSLMQDGIEVAKVVPAEDKSNNDIQNDYSNNDYNGMTSEELAKHRQEVMERVKVFSKKVAKLWSTDENAAEAVANNRR